MRLGCVKYLNARPLIHGWPEPVVLDHPSALCRQLAAGELDVALVSSFEFFRNPIYKIVDGVAIASNGPVYSVVVAHVGESLNFEKVELDPASETSVALLQYFIRQRARPFHPVPIDSGALSPVRDGHARLLIGDQAIRFRQKFAEKYRYWDLGEEWKRLTGLPFVYALWLVRPEVSNAAEIGDRLRHVRDQNIANLQAVIAGETGFPWDFCVRYYTEYLRFTLDEQEKAGLGRFGEACAELGLIRRAINSFQLI